MAINIPHALNMIQNLLQPILPYMPSLPVTVQSAHGKVYEFLVLADLLESLATSEQATFRLNNSSGPLTCNLAPGQIDRTHNFIIMRLLNQLEFEIHLDIEFRTLSASQPNPNNLGALSDLNELDIAILNPGLSGNPPFPEVILGVECKDTPVNKGHIRNMLGLRRELSLLQRANNTHIFASVDFQVQNSYPPSLLIFYSSDHRINHYEKCGLLFDIKLRELT